MERGAQRDVGRCLCAQTALGGSAVFRSMEVYFRLDHMILNVYLLVKYRPPKEPQFLARKPPWFPSERSPTKQGVSLSSTSNPWLWPGCVWHPKAEKQMWLIFVTADARTVVPVTSIFATLTQLYLPGQATQARSNSHRIYRENLCTVVRASMWVRGRDLSSRQARETNASRKFIASQTAQ